MDSIYHLLNGAAVFEKPIFVNIVKKSGELYGTKRFNITFKTACH
jgi:hypothetical protein